jgi:hypothetical protein
MTPRKLVVAPDGSLSLATVPVFGGSLGLTRQFGIGGSIFALKDSPAPLQYSVSGGSAGEVVFASQAQSELASGGALDPAAGPVRSRTLSAVNSAGGRYLVVLDSSTKKSISVLEVEKNSDGALAVNSWAVLKDAVVLPEDTRGLLGIALSYDPTTKNGTVVTGDANSTWAIPYNANVSGNRLRPPTTIVNPAGFHFLHAGAADSAGRFWVIGVNGKKGDQSHMEIRYLDTAGSGTWSLALAEFDAPATSYVVPAFDPYGAGRMMVMVANPIGTPVTLYALTPTSATETSTSANETFDFSQQAQAPPLLLAPTNDGGVKGIISGKSAGAAVETIYAVDPASCAISSVLTTGPEPTETLTLQRPDVTAAHAVRITPGGTGAVAGGDK